MAAQADKRGLKRVCTECGMRFYDMNKRPIMCPGCDAEFTGVEKIKARRGRAKIEEAEAKVAVKEAEKKTANDDEDDAVLDPEVEVVSLDDLETPDVDDDEDDVKAVAIDLDDDSLDDLDVDPEEDDSLEDIEADIDPEAVEKE